MLRQASGYKFYKEERLMRITSRAIIVNKEIGKILMINCLDEKANSTKDFTEGFWVLPGGGVEENESFEEGLIREIFEETGITDVELKNCVMSRIAYFDIQNELKLFYERYYLAETNSKEVTMEKLTDYEINVVRTYKWWDVQEMKSSDELIFPLPLKDYIDEIIKNPSHPIDITNSEEILKMYYKKDK